MISIHALREESDPRQLWLAYAARISIHALREESDLSETIDMLYSAIFQSTLSARRATGLALHLSQFRCISIHALREESDLQSEVYDLLGDISIHALREESDACCVV